MKILLSARKDPVNYIEALRPYGCECTVYDGSQGPTEYDGLLLCGGGDIAPRYFGQQNLGSVGIDAERDAWEFEILDAFVKAVSYRENTPALRKQETANKEDTLTNKLKGLFLEGKK